MKKGRGQKLTMIDPNLNECDMLFEKFLFRQELQKWRYNQHILFDKDSFPKRLDIKSIVYEELRPTCEYCSALHYIKKCLLLATPKGMRKTIFDGPHEK